MCLETFQAVHHTAGWIGRIQRPTDSRHREQSSDSIERFGALTPQAPLHYVEDDNECAATE